MKKMTALKIFLWLIVVLWMGVIFSMSAQTAVQSSELSGSTVENVLKIFYPGFNELSVQAQTNLTESFQFAARKTAHACIYAVLGGLCFCAVMLYDFKKRYKLFLSFAISVMYAVSDEIHQLFVEGRACEFRDVCIDSLGALCGILSGFIIFCLVLKIKSKKMP